MKMNWKITTDPDVPLLQQILHARGISEKDLYKTIDDLPDEALLANIDIVAQRIKKALYNNDPMVIFGHDDPDGITSVYILHRFLESCGFQRHSYFMPNRNIENHGIQNSFLNHVREKKYALVITVDNGISAYEGIEQLNSFGCDVIVTDHHLIQSDKLPNAYALLNPQHPDSKYPYKMLSGVGVVYMLIRYMSKLLEHPIDPVWGFWTAVGSIADKVPMTGVNRIIVRDVVNSWDIIKDESLDFLLQKYNRVTSVTEKINFMQYCSRLIANGREHNGDHKAMKFLLHYGEEKASMFQTLEKEKNSWEIALNNVFKLVDTLIDGFDGDAFIYYDDEDLIPFSLLGTAATYIVNNLNIPALFLKDRNDIIVCEGRCNKGFNIVAAFTYCKDHLIQFGGHVRAAGFTMSPDNYNAFIEKFHDYIKQSADSNYEKPDLNIDAVLKLENLKSKLWYDLEILLPYGQENPEPTILIEACKLQDLMDKYSVDNSITAPIDINLDAVFQLKGVNSIRLLDYRETKKRDA